MKEEKESEAENDPDPPTEKRPKVFAKKINDQAKQIVYNIYSFFKLRKQDRSSTEYINDVNLNKLVAQASGISLTTVSKIISEGNDLKREQNCVVFTSPEKTKQIRKKKIIIDDFTESVIKRMITQYYTNNKKVPTLETLNASLKEEGILNCSREYLRLLLHKLGFKFKKGQSKIMLPETHTMGNDKEDSGFGFKDRAKAEETLRLLESHDMNYRRLTVRGLLGRAKRVLSMTKAEEKVKNIKEAMEVFEKWLAELEHSKKTDKTQEKKGREENNVKQEEETSDVEMEVKKEKEEEQSPKKEKEKDIPSDKVPNLGFKDKEAAEATLKELEGRDPEYQRLAIKGLIGNAKRVLTCTKNETKVANIEEALAVFDKFLDDFETNHLGRQNNNYLSLGIVKTCLGMGEATEQQKAFIAAYESVGGEYKRLRTVKEKEGGKTWDIVRNGVLKGLKEKHAKAKLFNDKDEPTKEHLEMLLWAYSPEAAKVSKVIPEFKVEVKKEERETRKRKSSSQEETPSKKTKED